MRAPKDISKHCLLYDKRKIMFVYTGVQGRCPYDPVPPRIPFVKCCSGVERCSIGFASKVGAGPNTPFSTEVFIVAYIPKDQKAEPVEEISIYALAAPSEKKVFVWKALSRNLRRTFTDHYNLYNEKTVDMVRTIKAERQIPLMFLLDEIVTIHKLAYNHCVAWARYFKEHGYDVVPMKNITVYADDLSDTQQKIYDSIQQIPVEEVCGPHKNLFPNYRPADLKRAEEDETKRYIISVPVEKDEFERIKKAAKQNGRSTASFCRERILAGRTVNFNFDFAMEFFNEMIKNRELLRQILYTIYMQKSYTKVDLENIQILIDEVFVNARQINKEFERQVKELKKETI